ncbi:hypothetical protein [Paenibacillus sp. S25]|uniref:hypothetical protein n=1 Tax=Paenibacillus sp. S25 TaxID=2823905 RepID=UPI001C653553|nr:hypothetical protein [Paenibacillus sp. S25]QYK61838.1 hypothetical protein KAI37_02162 [Paenibacillus sp. S25]
MITLTIIEGRVTHIDDEFEWYAPVPTGETEVLSYIDPVTGMDETAEFIKANGGLDKLEIEKTSDGEYRCTRDTLNRLKAVLGAVQ